MFQFSDLIVIGSIFLFVILVQVMFIRWVFRINEQLNNQKAMIYFLINIAMQGGMPTEEVEKIKKWYKI